MIEAACSVDVPRLMAAANPNAKSHFSRFMFSSRLGPHHLYRRKCRA
jgi:hypothetical protein